jgi:uncharacterized protein involved in exopolysaccharide biosynthesis
MAQEIIPAGIPHPAPPARPDNRESWDATKEFVLLVVFKWKRLIILLFMAFTCAAAIAMYLKPPVRSATAEILIKGDRMPLQLSGLAARSDKGQISQVMNSEVKLIESRQVLMGVAKKLLIATGKNFDDDDLEEKTRSLGNSTFAVPLSDTSVLQVTYVAQTTEEALKNLTLIVEEYIDQQAAIQSGSNKLLKFYEQEKQRVEKDLRTAEDQLNDWQGKNQTVSILQQITSQLNILEDRRRSLQQLEGNVEGAKAKIAILQDQLYNQPERLMTEQDQMLNPLVPKLKEQRLAAQVALQDLLQKFTEKHRLVIDKKEQIALIDKELAAAEEHVIGRETTSVNPLRTNLRQQLSDGQAQLSSLTQQKQTLLKQVHDASAMLAELREKKVKIDELSRIVDLNKDAFMLYGKKLEEGRIATGLGKEMLANVALIGPPHASTGTDFNRRILMVIVAAVAGIGLGTGLAFGLEFLSNVLRTRQDVEYYLGLPMLAAIPELPPRPLMLNQ